MKILHLLSQRPECTGSGFFFQAMLKHSALAGHENYALCGVTRETIPSDEIFYGAGHDYVFFNNKEMCFPIPGMSDVMPYENKTFCSMNIHELNKYKEIFTKKISSIIKNFKPDIILSHHLWIMTAMAKKAAGDIPACCISHGTDLRQIKNCGNIAKDLMAYLQKIDMTFALSKAHAKEINDLTGIKKEDLRVCASGFDDNIFYFGKKSSFLPLNILYAGKLSKAKGLDLLIKAFENIEDLEINLYIAGSGSGNDQVFFDDVRKKSLGNIKFLGAISQTELADLMRKSHIFVLPSFFEGLPLVLLEAAACGCRIITTDLPGALELFENSKQDLVHFINLPKLETADTPYEKDIPFIVESIEKAIRNCAADILNGQEEISTDTFSGLIEHYKWGNVYKRVEAGIMAF